MGKKILLLGANERACFSVARNLNKHGYTIGVANWGYHPIARSRFVNEFHVLPAMETDLASFFHAFEELISKNSYWLVLPVNDRAVEFLQFYKAGIEKYTIVGGINCPGALLYSQNKYELWKVCKELGIHSPATQLVTSLEEFGNIKIALQYPVIAKPVSSRKVAGNKLYSFTVRKFSSEEPLEDFIRERILSIPILLQEVVNGFGIGFNFLSKNGKLLAYYMHERINEPKGGGESSYRKTITTDKYGIVEKSRQLIERINWNGVGMIEYKVDNGQTYIMELNGRFWGSIELGIFAGMELPYWQVLYNYEAEPIPGHIITCEKEVYARNFLNDLLSCIKERSVKSLFKWIGSVPRMFRSTERIEDSVFTDFRFRVSMWANLASRMLTNRTQSIKRKFISLEHNGIPAYKDLTKVLFVCEGNICRSPFAEKYLQKIRPGIVAASAGLQYQSSKMSPLKAVRTAAAEDIDLSGHRSRYIADIDANEFDAVFIMDKGNYLKLKKHHPGLLSKTYFLDQRQVIADPFGKEMIEFEICYKKIKELLDQKFS
ncbi:MAG: ATP-grasp domain-containing protein [Bacteroidota bacterium]|nr:ATP-grasp domain-containing protein [Bacteroidota bacterium]